MKFIIKDHLGWPVAGYDAEHMIIARGTLATAKRFDTEDAAAAWAAKYACAGFGLTRFTVEPDPDESGPARLGKDAAVELSNYTPGGWIPVSKALPDCDATVLVFSSEEKASAGWIDTDDSWVRTDGLKDPVTHWRPLPDYPADAAPETEDEIAETEALLKKTALEGIASINDGIIATLDKLTARAFDPGADLELLDGIEEEMRNAERILDELLLSL